LPGESLPTALHPGSADVSQATVSVSGGCPPALWHPALGPPARDRGGRDRAGRSGFCSSTAL